MPDSAKNFHKILDMLEKDTPTIDKQLKQSIKLHEEKKMEVEQEEAKVSEFKTEP